MFLKGAGEIGWDSCLTMRQESKTYVVVYLCYCTLLVMSSHYHHHVWRLLSSYYFFLNKSIWEIMNDLFWHNWDLSTGFSDITVTADLVSDGDEAALLHKWNPHVHGDQASPQNTLREMSPSTTLENMQTQRNTNKTGYTKTPSANHSVTKTVIIRKVAALADLYFNLPNGSLSHPLTQW